MTVELHVSRVTLLSKSDCALWGACKISLKCPLNKLRSKPSRLAAVIQRNGMGWEPFGQTVFPTVYRVYRVFPTFGFHLRKFLSSNETETIVKRTSILYDFAIRTLRTSRF